MLPHPHPPQFRAVFLNTPVNQPPQKYRDLVTYYREDTTGLPVKEARKRREFWHWAAKFYLVLECITSDDIGPPPSHSETRNGERSVISDRVVPFAFFWWHKHNGQVVLNWTQQELIDLYRVTKPPKVAPARQTDEDTLQ